MGASREEGLLTGMLTREHRKLDDLWGQALTTLKGEVTAAGTPLECFANELRRHIRDEEEIFFPGFEERTGLTAGPTAVMRMEHRQLEVLLQALAAGVHGGASDRLGEHAAALSSLLDSHDKKEEGMLYPMMDRVFDEDDGLALLARAGLKRGPQ
ncbi:MAG TPA: hemerythrin domain-containing protein [Candidatus Binataceae bacterium]|nr:hemerythrin domain-containing protein [Candidatus Binataceae bacterium]